ncbi:MAG: hypothetical protein EAX86_06725 [Candidatus Heimdallarchaeota archaeon]|nr:hypothetical protein [Candidatus Heimdallarchaeota archaeon]
MKLANGAVMVLLLPSVFISFILIIILIYYSTAKEKEFTESAKLLIENHFPQLSTTIISEGGFFSNPEIQASPSNTTHPIRDLDLKYKVYGSGKHQHQDLLLSAVISAEKSVNNEFSAIIKKEGVIGRIFGGENVQLGHQILDDRLLIRGSNPGLVQSYLIKDNFQIASKIANISDLKECKLEHCQDTINVVIRSDHTDIRYVSALLNLISAIANIDALYPKSQEKRVFGTITRKATAKIPHRRQRFKNVPASDSYEGLLNAPSPISMKENNQSNAISADGLFEQIKESLFDISYIASKHKISDTSAELIFNIGFFQKINFTWDTQTIQVSGTKKESLIPFWIEMTVQSIKKEEMRFYDPFEDIEVRTDPKELADTVKKRFELAQILNKMTGDFPTTIEITSDQHTIRFSIMAPTHPDNIDPLCELSQSIGWFLEFSFL